MKLWSGSPTGHPSRLLPGTIVKQRKNKWRLVIETEHYSFTSLGGAGLALLAYLGIGEAARATGSDSRIVTRWESLRLPDRPGRPVAYKVRVYLKNDIEFRDMPGFIYHSDENWIYKWIDEQREFESLEAATEWVVRDNYPYQWDAEF